MKKDYRIAVAVYSEPEFFWKQVEYGVSAAAWELKVRGVTVDFLGARWIGADAGKSWTLWKNAMKLASNVVVVVVNYVLSKRVIFRKK